MKDRETKDEIALGLLGIIGLFVAGTMVTMIILAFAGAGTGEGGERVWAGLFSLVTACLGALAGYVGGKEVAKRQNGNGSAATGESGHDTV